MNPPQEAKAAMRAVVARRAAHHPYWHLDPCREGRSANAEIILEGDPYGGREWLPDGMPGKRITSPSAVWRKLTATVLWRSDLSIWQAMVIEWTSTDGDSTPPRHLLDECPCLHDPDAAMARAEEVIDAAVAASAQPA